MTESKTGNKMIGKRVSLIYTSDQYTTLVAGDEGTVSFVDDAGTVFVDWDNGSSLGLLPKIDKWNYLD